MNHHCHARGCQIEVAPEMLMCYKHWRQVPKNIQQAVWVHYRPGQCDDKHPSEHWHIAADAAIGYVAQKEGQKVRDKEVAALAQFGYSSTQTGRVVHCKRENFDVYIGRGSKWGNPYSHKEGTAALWVVETREDAIRLYEEWLRAQPELLAAVKTELKDKILGCWCKPLACHGDILLKFANEPENKND